MERERMIDHAVRRAAVRCFLLPSFALTGMIVRGAVPESFAKIVRQEFAR